VFLQPWLRIHIDNNNELRWWQRHVHRVWVRRLVLQRQWRPAHRVLLLPWVCINGDDIECLRQYIFHVPRSRVWRG
jgi:hypothetical protein